MYDETSLGKDAFKHILRANQLSFDEVWFLTGHQDVVQNENEGLWIWASASSWTVYNQTGLGLPQECYQVRLAKVANTPDHVDGAIVKMPPKVLHVGFGDVA